MNKFSVPMYPYLATTCRYYITVLKVLHNYWPWGTRRSLVLVFRSTTRELLVDCGQYFIFQFVNDYKLRMMIRIRMIRTYQKRVPCRLAWPSTSRLGLDPRQSTDKITADKRSYYTYTPVLGSLPTHILTLIHGCAIEVGFIIEWKDPKENKQVAINSFI